MGLLTNPPAREETVTAGSQIKSNTLNKLQDAAVAERALHELDLHVSMWLPVSNYPTYSLGVLQHPGAGNMRSIMPLQIPVGALVQEITVGYFRGTGSVDVVLVKHKTDATVAQTTRNLVTADNTGAVYETQTITATGAGLAIGGGVGPLVMEAGFSYALDFAITGGTTGSLGPVQVKYYPYPG